MTNQSPDEVITLGRAHSGQFARGNKGGPGGYRSQRIKLYDICVAKAVRENYDLQTAVWQVVKAMIDRAIGSGDVGAAKLVFNALCESWAVDSNLLMAVTDAEHKAVKKLAKPKV
jgi:hypothetical protein